MRAVMNSIPVTAALLRTMPLPDPEGGDKERRGRVLVIAGSAEVPGAALLAGVAVLRAGAGKLQIGAGRSLAPHLAIALPEARLFALPETEKGGIAPEAAAMLLPRARQCGAVLVGPGMVEAEPACALAARLLDELAEGPPLVLDAAAMRALAARADRHGAAAGKIVITPHAGEAAGLLDTTRAAVESDPADAARQAAARFGAVVALKGAETHVATADGESYVFRGGTIGLATSGSGDVLAGIMAGLLARGASPLAATLWAVHLHGEAGAALARRHGAVGFLARELPAEIPGLLAGPAR